MNNEDRKHLEACKREAARQAVEAVAMRAEATLAALEGFTDATKADPEFIAACVRRLRLALTPRD